MRVFRRIVARNQLQYDALVRAGVVFQGDRDWIDFPEDDPCAERVTGVCKELDIWWGMCHTKFTEQERASASYLIFRATWENGNPQPPTAYEDIVYDTGDFCRQCRVGAVQIAPFRLWSEPKWGRRPIFNVGGEPGHNFVTEELYERVFKPAGVGCWPVLRYRKETVIPGVVQLKPAESVPVDVAGVPTETCRECGRVKYNWPTRGFLPMPYRATAAYVESAEWFGSGGEAAHMPLISQGVYRQIKDLKAAHIEPCADAPYDARQGSRGYR